MSFLKKIFGTEEKELDLEEAIDYFESNTKKERKQKRKELNKLEKNVLDEIKEFKSKISNLKQKETEDKLGKTAENARDDYCRKVNNLLKDFEKDFDYEKNLDTFFKKLNKAYPKGRSAKYISHFFEEQFNKAKKHLKKSIKLLEKINKEKKLPKDYKNILSKRDALNKKINKNKEKNKQIKELKSQLEDTKEIIKKLESKIEGETKSKKEKELEKEIEKLNNQKKEIKDSLKSKIRFLPRLYRKYEYKTSREVKKEPFDILLNEQERFKDIINKIIDFYNEDELDVDKNKIKKLKELNKDFDEIKIHKNEFKEIINKLRSKKKCLQKREAQREDKIRNYKKSLAEKKEELNEIKTEIKNLKSEINKNKKIIKKINEEIEKKISNYCDDKIKIGMNQK